jgi:NSS family neurotransmitter:Na+ symporter
LIEYRGNSTEYYEGVFNGLLGSPLTLISFSVIVTLATAFVNFKGIVKGVEKINYFFLPVLFVVFVILIIRVLTLDNAVSGLSYIFTFDINALPKAIIPALGQAMLSLSIGASLMFIFGSHTQSNHNLVSGASTTVFLGALSGVFASLLIIPAVASFGYSMSAGPGLTFLTLPKIFSQIGFGVVFATLFFFVVALAAFTSCIAMFEVGIVYVVKILSTTRGKAIGILAVYCFISNIVMSLSLNVWSDFKIFGTDLFSLASGELLNNSLIIGVLLVILTLAIGLSREAIKNQLTNDGTLKFYFFKTWLFATIFIAPLIIIASIAYSIFG